MKVACYGFWTLVVVIGASVFSFADNIIQNDEINLSPAGWRLAVPGWRYEFPLDHFQHSEFQTEWWYFTGNLREEGGGREFGFQLTFFRQGILPKMPEGVRSRFATRDIGFAHFAISDLSRGRYWHTSRWGRVALGGVVFPNFQEGEVSLARIGNWEVRLVGEGAFLLRANDRQAGMGLELELRSRKPPVIHGSEGVSQKAEGKGRASHYYSLTRLEARGILEVNGRRVEVSGQAWFDQEWATNQLTREQVGWDWFSLQFDDGTELMLFQIRRRDGTRDPHSSGTFVMEDGTTIRVVDGEFRLEGGRGWRSSKSGATYPMEWEVKIPKLELKLRIEAVQEEQEFTDPPIVYWEGAIRAWGERGERRVGGRGYLEMTGYGSRIVGMQAE